MEREIILREEINLWDAAWGSVDFNHRVLLFSEPRALLAVALGNHELHRCVAAALHLELVACVVVCGAAVSAVCPETWQSHDGSRS